MIPILLLLCLDYMVNKISVGSLFVLPFYTFFRMLIAIGKQPRSLKSQAFIELYALEAPIFGLSSETRKDERLLHASNYNFITLAFKLLCMGEFMLLVFSFVILGSF